MRSNDIYHLVSLPPIASEFRIAPRFLRCSLTPLRLRGDGTEVTQQAGGLYVARLHPVRTHTGNS